MRQLFIMISLLILFCTSSIAQNLNYGIEFGANATNLTYETNYDFWHPQTRYSMNAMFFTQAHLNSFISVKSGLRFVRLGSHIEYEDYVLSAQLVHVKGKHEVIQSYLSLPVKIQFNLPSIPFFAFAGPEIGYLLSAEMQSNQESPDQYNREMGITSKLHRYNVALNIGIGYRFNLINQNFYISTQYSYGLSKIGKDEYWGSNWKTNEISLNLGYQLPF